MKQERLVDSTGRLIDLMFSMSDYLDQMLDCLAALCRIPSVSGTPLPDAPFGQETADALEAFLAMGSKLGFRAVNLGNRAGYVEFGAGDRMIAILGHLDVVPAGTGWEADPFEPQILHDRLVARGAIDDKGPVVAALFAMKALADEGFAENCRIRLIVGLDEERGSECMAHYVKVAELPAAGFSPDACFPVIYAEKGIAWVELDLDGGQPADAALRLVEAKAGLRPNMVPGTCDISFAGPSGLEEAIIVQGQPAHASTPWEGRNAISQAMQMAADMLQEAGSSHPFVEFYQAAIGSSWRGEGLGIACEDESGPLTVNAGLLELDSRSASLTLDIRYPITQPIQAIEAALAKSAAPFGVRARIVKNLPPLHVPQDSSLVVTLMDTYRELTGQDVQPVAIGGGTYARSMPNIVAFGPNFPGDSEAAHQAGEYITYKTLLASAAIYRQALRRLAK